MLPPAPGVSFLRGIGLAQTLCDFGPSCSVAGRLARGGEIEFTSNMSYVESFVFGCSSVHDRA